MMGRFKIILAHEVRNFAFMNEFLKFSPMNANVLVAKKGHIPFFSERKVARENFRFSYTQTFILAILAIGGLLIYYAFLQNQNATRGYNVRTLQVEMRALQLKENLLDIRIAEGRSIDAVMNAGIINRMENVSNSSFLVLKDTQFTMNH